MRWKFLSIIVFQFGMFELLMLRNWSLVCMFIVMLVVSVVWMMIGGQMVVMMWWKMICVLDSLEIWVVLIQGLLCMVSVCDCVMWKQLGIMKMLMVVISSLKLLWLFVVIMRRMIILGIDWSVLLIQVVMWLKIFLKYLVVIFDGMLMMRVVMIVMSVFYRVVLVLQMRWLRMLWFVELLLSRCFDDGGVLVVVRLMRLGFIGVSSGVNILMSMMSMKIVSGMQLLGWWRKCWNRFDWCF